MTRIHCQSAAQGAFSILIPGIYSTRDFGAVGDSIAFTGPRSLPPTGIFYLEQLRHIEVTRR
jgi:hypothetical protein